MSRRIRRSRGTALGLCALCFLACGDGTDDGPASPSSALPSSALPSSALPSSASPDGRTAERAALAAAREAASEAAGPMSPIDPAAAPALAPEWDRSEPLEMLLARELEALDRANDAGGAVADPAAALDHPDPAVRMRAALAIDPDGGGVERLSELLLSDPDPRVRAATAMGLESSDSHVAVNALVRGLEDSEAEVVLQVIDALEFAGDETNVADLARLRGHADPRVREAVEEAIRFLE